LGLSTKNKISQKIEKVIELADKNMYMDKSIIKNSGVLL